ncbi:hypothetical protein L1987_44894 [Smallanthus sonchifolius]|uniref:Uncharacterized protein n=1 Tax=Smallanthus sonchifolius TaxID=185202 RepID=A0ACB9GQ47_9ASTR|nr:hypothetical protein L1987_44894 [Smallanthus sonchifolius]
MEEEKAAAYYDELTRKGGGTGESNISDTVTGRVSAVLSSSSFLSSFVRASSLSKSSDAQKQVQMICTKG